MVLTLYNSIFFKEWNFRIYESKNKIWDTKEKSPWFDSVQDESMYMITNQGKGLVWQCFYLGIMGRRL